MNSSELKGYLTGLIIGDGYIDHGITKRSFEIKSINYDFIKKIETDLKSCTVFDISVKYVPEHFSCGCNHKESWVLKIKAHPYFAKKYHHFYDDRRNGIIRKEAINWLTPNGIANWYMSDGYVCLVGKTKGIIKNRRVDICTDRYSYETVQKLSNMLYNKFNIYNSIVKRGRFYRLRISYKSYMDFINLIRPYIVQSFEYKLYLGYEQQPIWMPDDFWCYQQNLKSAIALTSNVEG